MNIKHLTRFKMVTTFGICAFCIIALASYEGSLEKENYFYLALFASVLVGIASAMGEATFLGYTNFFPSHVVGFVSSGTGFAGISGTGTLLILQGIGLSN